MNRQDLLRRVRSLSADAALDLFEHSHDTPYGPVAAARVSVRARNRVIQGSGIDPHRETAIDKALCEIMERNAFFESAPRAADFRPAFPLSRFLTGKPNRLDLLANLGTSSVGCAAHPDRRTAKANALQELVERHTLLVAQLTETPGTPREALTVDSRWGPVDIRSFSWRGPLNTHCALAEAVNRLDGRTIFGSGAGKTPSMASEKAVQEAVLLLDNFESRPHHPLPLESCRTIDDIKQWHMNTPSSGRFYDRPPTPLHPPEVDATLTRGDFWIWESCLGEGLYFCRAYSPETQNLFVGRWTREATHPRLRRYWRHGIAPPYAY